jgi:serine/threonine protein kinase
LTDFGLSKLGFNRRERSFSFCGSPEYMSPEMLGTHGHDRMLDYYSMGALLFELLTGLPPYYSRNREEMY